MQAIMIYRLTFDDTTSSIRELPIGVKDEQELQFLRDTLVGNRWTQKFMLFNVDFGMADYEILGFEFVEQ